MPTSLMERIAQVAARAMKTGKIMEAKLEGTQLTMWEIDRRPRRPSCRQAFADGMTSQGPGHVFADFTALFIGMGVFIAAPHIIIPSTVWLIFGVFMMAVCTVLKVAQRTQLVYYNQTLCWLGAPTPPLDVNEDGVACVAEGLQHVFQIFAVAAFLANQWS